MKAEEDLARLGLTPHHDAPPRLQLGIAARARSWAWVHRRAIGGLVPLLALAGVVQAWGASRTPAPFDDEGTYIAQAWAVQTQHHLAHYTYWYDHPPLGWIQLAGWTWLTHGFERADHAVLAGREAMVVACLVASGLLYVLARRIGIARGLALAAVALFTLSPLAVAQHRMVLLDNIAVPWLLGAFVLAASPRRSLWAALAAGACMGVAVLTKETFLLLTVAVIWQLWSRCDRRTRSFCLTAFGVGFVTILVGYPLFALLKGELLPGPGHVSLLDAVRFQLVGRPSSGFVLDGSSAAHATVSGWLGLDRWLLVAGAVAAVAALFSRRLRPLAVAMAIQLLMLLRGGYLPGPFVVAMLPLAALLIVGVANELWQAGADWARPRQRSLDLGRPAVALVSIVALLVIGPTWVHGDRALATVDSAAPTWQAESWVAHHVPRTTKVIVDDTMWLDLVRDGFDPATGVVWFFKLDSTNNLDPSVAQRLPNGWREFGFVVSTPYLRQTLDDNPGGLQPVRDALDHSTVRATFGDGGDRIEVRQIDAGGA